MHPKIGPVSIVLGVRRVRTILCLNRLQIMQQKKNLLRNGIISWIVPPLWALRGKK